MVQVGQQAPDFTLKGVVGKGDFKPFKLSDFKGKWVVLFFYPLDFTFICPTEITEFSRRHDEFEKLNAVVLGCSVDSVHSHKAWIQGQLGELKYPLLSDMLREASRKYGALLEEKGHTTRATFIVDPNGILQYANYHNTEVGRSVTETLRVLAAAQTGERCPVEWKPGAQTLGRPG
jgi:alkyl hydroperoxide reductase subunit AhpC